jgi:Cd2+/Zn2+-exporting ATPase
MTETTRNGKSIESKTYRVEGFSCINCAGRFESNVKQLQGVIDANVNFGASKITVQGTATIEEIQQAGAFEHLVIREENARKSDSISFWKHKQNFKVYISALILLISMMIGHKVENRMIGYIASMLIGGYSLFWIGIKNLFRFKFDMNTLMTIAIIGASILGEWKEAATVVILFAISEALERFSMDKSRKSIETLVDLSPIQALVRKGSKEIFLNVEDININDVILVKPGEKIAMDGRIIKGDTSVNQSSITGESTPVTKSINDEVFAGTLNVEGFIEVMVTKPYNESTLAKIIHLVEEAQAEKAPSQLFVEKFAKIYTPFILLLASMVAIIPPVFNGDWGNWIYEGLAILVVGCPCALVVSTPVAVVTAIGNAAKNGVLIKGGIYLEQMGKLEAIAFDKTGTLTRGIPTVSELVSLKDESHRFLPVLAAIESKSHHPIAKAIVEELERRQVNYNNVNIDNVVSHTGNGISASFEGDSFFAGKPSFFVKMLSEIPTEIANEVHRLEETGLTVILFGNSDGAQFIISVEDEIRPNISGILSKLKMLGLKLILLTGDNHGSASLVGDKIGIDNVKADLLPEDKLNVIKQYSDNQMQIAMIGDGVNDAPALAAASVGIGMR